VARADELNRDFEAWRKGEDQPSVTPDSISWLRQQDERDEAFTDLAENTQRDYSAKFQTLEQFLLKKMAVSSVQFRRLLSSGGMQKRYRELKERGPYLANAVMRCARLLWNWGIAEQYLTENPFQTLRLKGQPSRETVWTPTQVAAFCTKARQLGGPSMALAGLYGI
jgi:hypothetical protein